MHARYESTNMPPASNVLTGVQYGFNGSGYDYTGPAGDAGHGRQQPRNRGPQRRQQQAATFPANFNSLALSPRGTGHCRHERRQDGLLLPRPRPRRRRSPRPCGPTRPLSILLPPAARAMNSSRPCHRRGRHPRRTWPWARWATRPRARWATTGLGHGRERGLGDRGRRGVRHGRGAQTTMSTSPDPTPTRGKRQRVGLGPWRLRLACTCDSSLGGQWISPIPARSFRG